MTPNVKPRWLVAEERLHDLVDAMTRYRRDQYIIPPEWFEEGGEIARWLEARKRHTINPATVPNER